MHQHLKQVKLEQAKTGREVDDSISSIDGGIILICEDAILVLYALAY
jgi:hypothetical protein